MSREGKVYIGGLPDDARAQEVEDTFKRFGRIFKTWVAHNPPGFAFVEFEDVRDAEDAVRALDGTRICGVRVKVELSHGRRRDNRGGGGRGGGYGGGRGGGRYDDRRGGGGYNGRGRSRSPLPRRGRSRSPAPRSSPRYEDNKKRSPSRSRTPSRSRSRTRSRSGTR